jgi:spore coat-associated protein N
MKKKFLAFALGSIIATSGIIGGTYAYFNDTETSTGNTFSAGTLNMSSFRDDIPIEGPMFYTNDSLDGTMGTGLWKPGDSHTRGIYIQNTGSLPAVFNKLYAVPEATDGTEAYNNAMAFANQSNVVISMYEWTGGSVDATAWSLVLKGTDNYIKNHYNTIENQERANNNNLTLDELKLFDMNALSSLHDLLLNQIFVTKNALGEDVFFKVKQVYTGELKNLVNPGHSVPNELKRVVQPGETVYLGYTVMMQDLTPEVNNPLQGKEVKFSFAHEFVQN